MMATRRGKTAATDHQPLDFLNPPEGASLVAVEGGKPEAPSYPGALEPLSQEAVAEVDPGAVLRQLRSLAVCSNEGVDRVGLSRRMC